MNINTKAYWDKRFSSGDWENKNGRKQTKDFALAQIRNFDLPNKFSGTILDFGCGMGDSFPIYKNAYPNAKLIGIDISISAIKKCKEMYGSLGSFISGSHEDVPMVDVIISSNVFEHLTDDLEIAKKLIEKCNKLFIIVPYKENILPGNEHVNTYDEFYFKKIGTYDYEIFVSKGWGEHGLTLLYEIYLKNILRLLFGKPLLKRSKQIMFKF
jgi:SAM-dependent methyltransferase